MNHRLSLLGERHGGVPRALRITTSGKSYGSFFSMSTKSYI
ncbi:hypothetical protein NH44784_017101 [Achromobacter xylosoxidans NH44784-1996]|nr:hypothetical protein NH44784_017101 [Achromobacter xylosoxidans NH44784-1996]